MNNLENQIKTIQDALQNNSPSTQEEADKIAEELFELQNKCYRQFDAFCDQAAQDTIKAVNSGKQIPDPDGSTIEAFWQCMDEIERLHCQLTQQYIEKNWLIWVKQEAVSDKEGFLQTFSSKHPIKTDGKYQCLKANWTDYTTLREVLNEEFKKFIGHLAFPKSSDCCNTDEEDEDSDYSTDEEDEDSDYNTDEKDEEDEDSVKFKQTVVSFIAQMMATRSGQRLIIKLNKELNEVDRIKIEKSEIFSGWFSYNDVKKAPMQYNPNEKLYLFTIINKNNQKLGITYCKHFAALFHELLHYYHAKRKKLKHDAQIEKHLGIETRTILKGLFHEQEEIKTIGDSSNQKLSEVQLYKEREIFTANRTHLADLDLKLLLSYLNSFNFYLNGFDAQKFGKCYQNLLIGLWIDCSSFDFTLCSFNNCHFEQVFFKKTDFSKAIFEDCTLKRLFIDIDSICTPLVKTYFTDTVFKNCNLESVAFERANLERTQFINTTFKYCNLSEHQLNKHDEYSSGSTNCTDAKFENCTLYNVKFKDANLKNTQFINTTFKNCKLSKIQWELVQSTKRSDFTGAKFENCTLDNVQFEDANLKNTQFINTTFKNTDFMKTDFSEAHFSGTTTFENCTLNGVKINPGENPFIDKTKVTCTTVNCSNHGENGHACRYRK